MSLFKIANYEVVSIIIVLINAISKTFNGGNYFIYLFELKSLKKKVILISLVQAVAGVLGVIILMVFGLAWYKQYGIFIVMGIIAPNLVILTSVIAIGIIKKGINSRVFYYLILGTAFIIFDIIIKSFLFALNPNSFFSQNYLLLGIAFFVYNYALAFKFNQEHKELNDIKETLEKRVQDRTLELEKANKQIREASQKQTDFFINLAHETRTPLQLILFNLESYVKKVKYSRDLKVIERNFNKLLRDMINFLDLTKLQRGQIFYDHSQIIDLVDVLKLKIDLFKNVAVKKNIKMDLNINVDNAYTKIDSFAIDRVINNLLDNAIKYSNQNGYINVSLKLDGNKIKMVIEDNGIGISKEQQKHIFEPYHQMSHEKRQYQGLGMGLNIVKKIIDEVKGIIDIKSELGKGTTFTLVFNKCNLSLKEGTVVDVFKKSYTNILPTLPVESSYDNKKPTLLIVEDNTELVGFLQKELGVEYNIYYAMNGQEALTKIKNIPKPDIILADIMMPVMDGYEMRERLCKTVEYAAIPFIFLTAKTKQNERIKGLQQGAIDFISKPVMIKELTTKLKSILKIQKAQKETEIKNKKRKQKDIYENYKITDKEQEIITLLKKGLEYKEIADKLKISINTVRTHMRRLFYKCNVVNKVEFLNLFKV